MPAEPASSTPPPALGRVLERNIIAVTRQRARARHRRSRSDRVADRITDFSGSMAFVYLHLVWFGVWVIANTGFFGLHAFDPFPYGLLTMIVSLEAIFLSTFVLISQNRMGEENDHRADLDLQVDLLAEHETTRILQMLQAIQDHLGITDDRTAEIAELELDKKPEDVLDAIEKVQARMLRK